jgi:hypothetical protein
MSDDSVLVETDECGYVYWYWLDDSFYKNPNGLRWLYDDE